ncbi:metal ABC transporter permease [Olivibacter sp. SDN3]|uniref:metal ABC transporter permease n=1 Tax=Olivibacter sp. SDN3 TaxID=2764720 RepID=UPI00165150F7|nr:iron chelate uptake ABC transporter family permease subunit [Olivibacter sp. SDN3]QNL48874.1 metal ABC transporter permease [Olivibacter sp. SDN3]
MEDLITFFSFTDPNIRYVVLGAILLAASSAIVGCFTLLKKKALVGDAVAHSVLPGVCAAFLFAGDKNTVLLIVGAFITGWISLLAIDYITAKSKIKQDAAIGLVLSVFFGVGIVLLTFIQQSGNSAQSGLDNFIFGKAAALVGQDLWVFSIISIVLLVVVSVFFKELTLVAFDESYAISLGLPVRGLDVLLTTLTVLAVVTGITAVGVVLMAAMLITPGSAARYWTDNIRIMVLLAAIFGAISGIAGAYISYVAPSMPTGPWMVVVSSIIAVCSFLLAPRKGIIARWYNSRQNRFLMLEENTLKVFYHLGEEDKSFQAPRSIAVLLGKRALGKSNLYQGLKRLKIKGLLEPLAGQWQLTAKGVEKAAKVVKLHRLWELYLTNYMKIAPDHVHDDAETIEHIITPEIETELEHLLDYPKIDPHKQEIPRS